MKADQDAVVGRLLTAAKDEKRPDPERWQAVATVNRVVALVLMPVEFLLRLYERVRDAEDRFRRRWPHFATELREAMMKRNAHGYEHLTRQVADELADRVLGYEEVHPVVVEDTLKTSLDTH